MDQYLRIKIFSIQVNRENLLEIKAKRFKQFNVDGTRFDCKNSLPIL